ncbi:MAG: hypothetical protein ACJ789_03855 [Thermomicrobiales bacterium]
MFEFLAILAGIPVGLMAHQFANQRWRVASLLVLSLVIGFTVAAVAGELAANIGFGFFDALQCAAGAAVTWALVARYRTNTMR